MERERGYTVNYKVVYSSSNEARIVSLGLSTSLGYFIRVTPCHPYTLDKSKVQESDYTACVYILAPGPAKKVCSKESPPKKGVKTSNGQLHIFEL